MSGGATVLEAIGAIAKLELPVEVIGWSARREPAFRSLVKQATSLRTMNSKTVEINNTDAEGVSSSPTA